MLFSEEKLKSTLAASIEWFKNELKKVSTGKPNASVIGELNVEAYGTTSKLNTLSQVVVEDAVTVKIMPWDKSILGAVEKALKEQVTGANVQPDSGFLRLKFLPITEEDRKLKVKEVGKLAEETKIKVRQIRHNTIKDVDDAEGVSEDDQKRDKEKIQKIIDDAVKSVDELAKSKEQDLMVVK